jgi:Polyketide cyclase / dehydrase and lipid transport
VGVATSFAGWRRLELVGEVTDHRLPTAFAYRIVEGPLRATNAYRLHPDDGGTSFTMTGEAAMPGLVMRLFGPLVVRAYTRTTRREVGRLVALLDGA